MTRSRGRLVTALVSRPGAAADERAIGKPPRLGSVNGRCRSATALLHELAGAEASTGYRSRSASTRDEYSTRGNS